MRSSIVVGVDGSRAATRAARVAASLARRLDYRLVLAHVASDPPVFPNGAPRARELQRRGTLEHATSVVDAVAKTIGEPRAKKAVVVSDVASGLADIADNEGAALVAIGSRRGKRWGRPRQSRVALALEAVSSCPVLVVSAAAAKGLAIALQPPVGAVIVGVDGSPVSTRARVVAAGLAGQLGLSVTPVFVKADESQATIDDAVVVSNEDPVAGLSAAARSQSASLLVVGASGGRRGAPSVAERLHRSSPVPLVVVPSDSHLAPFVTGQLAPHARAA
jgi:nucleotide-binding universal stress UspA family protein